MLGKDASIKFLGTVMVLLVVATRCTSVSVDKVSTQGEEEEELFSDEVGMTQ